MDTPPQSLLLELLLDLAYDASSYLRAHAKHAVRISAALLVAGSLAACGGLPSFPGSGQGSSAAVQPLSQEIRSGLPSQPGRYAVSDSSLVRDQQGVYHFNWNSLAGPGGGPAGQSGTATVSRLRLAQADNTILEIPQQGDPILYLRPQASIPLVSNTTGSGYRGYGTWYPFYSGGYRGTGYYDPPSRAVSQGGSLYGSNASSAPAAPGDRTVGLPHTVSGRAGGTGSGSAASQKSGAGIGKSSSGGGAGAAAAKSGGFSSGRGGAGSGGGG